MTLFSIRSPSTGCRVRILKAFDVFGPFVEFEPPWRHDRKAIDNADAVCRRQLLRHGRPPLPEDIQTIGLQSVIDQVVLDRAIGCVYAILGDTSEISDIDRHPVSGCE